MFEYYVICLEMHIGEGTTFLVLQFNYVLPISNQCCPPFKNIWPQGPKKALLPWSLQ